MTQNMLAKLKTLISKNKIRHLGYYFKMSLDIFLLLKDKFFGDLYFIYNPEKNTNILPLIGTANLKLK